MRPPLALLTAVVAASLAPPLGLALWVLAGSRGHALPYFPLILIAGTPMAFLHVLVLGLPAAMWLRKVDAFRFFPMLFAGFVAGSVPSLFWRASSWGAPWQSLSSNLVFAGIAGLLGGLASVVFFLVYQGLNPDNPLTPSSLRSTA